MLLFSAVPASAELIRKEVTYFAEGQEMKGYLVYDAARDGERPGVLVVHEWWGLNDYARKRAEMLAKEGYLALAIDMYGGGKTTTHPKEAGEFSAAVNQNMNEAEKRFRAAMSLLREHELSDEDDIAAIGYCFGGGIVLEMARRGLPLDGVASFHGSLKPVTEAEQGKVKAEILVLHGADDPMVPESDVQAFREEMKSAEVDAEVIVYSGATHGFTNPGADEAGKKYELPLAYNKEADEKSWQKLLEFLKEVF